MRRLILAVVMVVLIAGLVMAQDVIKYELSSSSALNIGDAVKLGATDNSCDVAGAGEANAVIGFVGMTETDGTNYWNLIVNSGRITAAIHSASPAVAIGDSLTIAAGGSLQVAGAGDRVIAVATQAVGTPPGACEVMIQLGAISGAGGARIWQSAVGSMTDITGTAAAKQTLTSIAITDCDVEYMKVQFTGTADDKATSAGGAVVNVELDDGGVSMGTQTLYLVDRHFHQSQAVALTATDDVAPADDPTYTVYVWESNGMTNGRIKGVLTVVGTPR
ncbi:hypothetical protein DRQ33_04375 [bacterium]|nr:MAG: hypothetical protein DRQ33_04375 [bacterium]